MPTADLAAQRALIALAETDRALGAAAHHRETLPENDVIADGQRRADELRGSVALAEAELSDIDAAVSKLDDEIDAVRARAERDNARMTSGSVPAKELESLQQELESLARRQQSLEDDALELMEKRESADAGVTALRAELAALDSEVEAATVRRTDQWADIDDEVGQLTVERARLVAEIPAPVLAVYDRLHAAGKVAAAALAGDRCSACQMALDRQSLDAIHGADPAEVPRCPECGALLVREH